MKKQSVLSVLTLSLLSFNALADDVGCVSTTWRLVNNDKVCVESFHDPDIQGIACHLASARTGGVKGALGIAENPSNFSLSCRQTGPIVASKNIAVKQENIFTQKMSLLFKDLHVTRLVDKANNSLVYLVISSKIIDGSPSNSISTVPLMPWGTQAPQINFK